MKNKLMFIYLFVFYPLILFAQNPIVNGEKISYYKVWDEAPHNAFTSLCYFKNKFFLTFREGSEHASKDGRIRVIKSNKGYLFEEDTLFRDSSFDLRDPKIMNYQDSLLYLIYCKADRERRIIQTALRVSADGVNWSEEIIYNEGNKWWLWSLTNYKKRIIFTAYNYFDSRLNRLYELNIEDRNRFLVAKDSLFDQYYPGEASMALSSDGDTAFCAIRTGYNMPSVLGYSVKSDSLKKWSWKTDNYFIAGGPLLINLKDIGMLLLTRNEKNQLGVYSINSKTLSKKLIFVLPSGGDNGYAGYAVVGQKIYFSYYSSHEGNKARIYVAAMELDYLKNLIRDPQFPRITDYTFRIEVYPNPVLNRLYLRIFSQENFSNTNYFLYNISGKLVRSGSISIMEGVNTKDIDFKNEVSGLYLLRISNSENNRVVKVIKE